jgi:hypothetical protein
MMVKMIRIMSFRILGSDKSLRNFFIVCVKQGLEPIYKSNNWSIVFYQEIFKRLAFLTYINMQPKQENHFMRKIILLMKMWVSEVGLAKKQEMDANQRWQRLAINKNYLFEIKNTGNTRISGFCMKFITLPFQFCYISVSQKRKSRLLEGRPYASGYSQHKPGLESGWEGSGNPISHSFFCRADLSATELGFFLLYASVREI